MRLLTRRRPVQRREDVLAASINYRVWIILPRTGSVRIELEVALMGGKSIYFTESKSLLELIRLRNFLEFLLLLN